MVCAAVDKADEGFGFDMGVLALREPPKLAPADGPEDIASGRVQLVAMLFETCACGIFRYRLISGPDASPATCSCVRAAGKRSCARSRRSHALRRGHPAGKLSGRLRLLRKRLYGQSGMCSL
jgi:hypothetical protein